VASGSVASAEPGTPHTASDIASEMDRDQQFFETIQQQVVGAP
jgi:hypothetical protein